MPAANGVSAKIRLKNQGNIKINKKSPLSRLLLKIVPNYLLLEEKLPLNEKIKGIKRKKNDSLCG